MDSVDEDLSARVLLQKVLHTELPRSPVTRSSTRARRSVRLINTPGLESPGVALRHKLKQKLHQNAQSPLPPPKRQRSLGGKTNPPAAATPSLFDDDITPRGLLRGIIRMDPEASLLTSGQPAPQEAEPNPESSVSSAGERTEGLSGAELSDLTLHTEPLTHVVRKLSRRKPQPVFSVSAFEKELDQMPDKSVEEASDKSVFREKSDVSHDLDSSAGSKSGLNLTLKTPFVDKRTERAGLQRKVSNRKLPSADSFDEAVQRCLEQAPDQDHSQFQDGKTLEDSSWQKFTLGLNDVTELYVQPAGSTVQLNKDDMAVQDEEPERNTESNDLETEEYQENRLSYVDEIHDVPESIIQENKDHEVESALQDEEEMLPSSQEEAGDVSLSPEDEIMLAPTQAMTESPPKFQDAETHEPETEEDMDTSPGLEQKTRRAHRSEGGGGILKIPAGQRVTKSFGAGLNPREKDYLEFVNRTGENLQDVSDKEMEPQGSHMSPPLNLTTEVITEQRSQQHVASLDGEDLPDVEGAEAITSEQGSRHETSLTGKDLPEAEANTSEQASRHETSLTGKDLPEATTSEQGSRHETSLTDKDLPEATTSEQGSRHETSLTGKDLPEATTSEQGSRHETSLTGKDLPEATTSEQGSRHETSLTGRDLPDIEGDDLQDEESQSEDEDMMDSEPANQSPEPHSPAPSEQEEEDDDDDDARSAELSMKTPAFVKQKRVITNASAHATPTVLKELNSGPAPQVTKRQPRQKRKTGSDVLPKSYVMSVFKHFAKTKVASDVYPAINEILKKYFDRLADDLEVYATHAKRKTIEIEDFELLMRRQGFVTDSMPVNILIEKYLPLEYRKLLIPVATSGNKVVPNQKR
nr:centromere protein T isoform X1 [Misgurnus anguillicaudatus]